MTTQDNGGPAFPTQSKIGANATDTWITEIPGQPGMTLRDYFAAKAMATMLPTYSVPDVFDDDTESEGDPTMSELIAKDAYTMADAMLKAREQ